MPKVQGLKLSISDHPGDTDWMCGPVNGVSVYILQINRVNPDTESEWKYADSSTKSSATLKAIRRGRFGCASKCRQQFSFWVRPAI